MTNCGDSRLSKWLSRSPARHFNQQRWYTKPGCDWLALRKPHLTIAPISFALPRRRCATFSLIALAGNKHNVMAGGGTALTSKGWVLLLRVPRVKCWVWLKQ